jgi:hypothetical protein
MTANVSVVVICGLNAYAKFLSSGKWEIDSLQQLSRQEDDISLSTLEDTFGLFRISNESKQDVGVCSLDCL